MKKIVQLTIPGILISISGLLWLYINNQNEVRLDSLLLPLILSIITVFIIFFVINSLFRKTTVASIQTTVTVFLFFSFGSFFHLIEQYPIISRLFHTPSDKVTFIIVTLLCLLSIYFLRRKNFLYEKLFRSLFVASVVLNILPLYIIVSKEIQRSPIINVHLTTLSENKKKLDETPDIYYFIVERYANFGTLKKRYHLISSLEPYLRQEGYYIATASSPNYPHTALSLASSLNLNYLSSLQKNAHSLGGDQTQLFSLMNNSVLFNFLKQQGYDIIQLGDSWQGTEFNTNATQNYNYYGPLPAFTRLFLNGTIFGYLYRRYQYKIFNHIEGYKVEKKLSEQYKNQKLQSIVTSNRKKIVFAHLLVTHEPYILHRNGKPLTDEEFVKLHHEEKYINHIVYGNSVLEDFIKTIKKNHRPYIMILQADEGPYTSELRQKVDAGNFSWKNASFDAIKTHMSIINAYYFPNKNDYAYLYPSITPVNTFRIILNQYFNQHLPLLPDKQYLNKDFENSYVFKNITSQLSQ